MEEITAIVDWPAPTEDFARWFRDRWTPLATMQTFATEDGCVGLRANDVSDSDDQYTFDLDDEYSFQADAYFFNEANFQLVGTPRMRTLSPGKEY